MLIRRRTLLAASAATAIASPAIAQNYPRRAVQLIVAFPAGGSTDVGARILAASAEKDFGQPITVVNKARRRRPDRLHRNRRAPGRTATRWASSTCPA